LLLVSFINSKSSMNSNHKDKIKYSILKRYFLDQATDEEKELVISCFIQNGKNFGVENCMHLLWTDLDLNDETIEIDPDLDSDLDSLLDRIHHTINISRQKEKIRKISLRQRTRFNATNTLKYLARVAAIILLPVIGYFSWQIYDQKNWFISQSEVQYNEIICPLGARSQFILPDGTTGSLNNGSRLRYPVKFVGETRSVELIGEAFFDVTKDKKRAFIINTTSVLDVKVLGTRLNVCSYPDEGYQEFTLESGEAELIKRNNGNELTVAKIRSGQHIVYSYKKDASDVLFVKEETEPVIIEKKEELENFLSKTEPGQHAVYEMEEGSLNIVIDNTDQFTAWKDGKLVLRKDPMPKLLKRIERWYNVKFNILDESINEYIYWATFEAENLDQVLRLLSLTGPIEFKKHDRKTLEDGTYEFMEIDVMLKK